MVLPQSQSALRRFLSRLALPAILICAAGLFLHATQCGVGVLPDSVQYVSAARRILEGHGVQSLAVNGQWAPLTRFPPMYPMLLAAAARLTGGDPLVAARLLHLLILLANVLLFRRLVEDVIPGSSLIRGLAVAGFALAPGVLRLHTQAMSEPLFMLFVLWGFTRLRLSRGATSWLPSALTGAMFGMACLTRYGGAAFVLGALWMLNPRRAAGVEAAATTAAPDPDSPAPTCPRRFRNMLGFALPALGSLGLWLLRNTLAGGTTLDRSWSVSAPNVRDAQVFLAAVWEWVLPGPPPGALLNAVAERLLLLAVAGVLCGIYMRSRRAAADRPHVPDHGRRLQVRAPLIVYGLFLLGTRCLTGMAPAFDERLMAPIFMLGLAPTLTWIAFRRGTPCSLRPWGWPLMVAWLVCSIVRSAAWADLVSTTGQALSAEAWRASPLMSRLQACPPDTRLVSNAPDLIYLWTRRQAALLPAHHEPISGRINSAFEPELERLMRDVRDGGTVVAMFDRVDWRWYLPTAEDLRAAWREAAPRVERMADGLLIAVKTDP